MQKVKLNIDFTKLAKIASVMNKHRVSEYLIQHEKQIVKKIPFLLEVSQFRQAFAIAVESGDPNNINKVISEILKAQKEVDAVVELVNTVPDGIRHLRNFAKKRRMVDILRAIFEFINRKKPEEVAMSGLQQSEFSEIAEIVKQVYEADNLKQRGLLMDRAAKSLQTSNKD
jgi:RNA polymerase-interacting CarD/CdnL/TRCF family regulator